MTALPAGLNAGTYAIDAAHASAGFSVRHMGIAKVRGHLAITGGTITIGDEVEDSSVTVEMDPATVNTRNADRDAHLRSADFFAVEEFPTWTFTSTAVRPAGEDYVIVGDLTMHGVTKSVELATEYTGSTPDEAGSRIGFEARTEISRKDFGLTWNVALEAGGVMVSDKVVIEIELEAVTA